MLKHLHKLNSDWKGNLPGLLEVLERCRLACYCFWYYHCVSWQARRFWKLETCSATLWPRTAFLRFPGWASSILQRGSKWFRFKGIGEFRQHAGCSDACCYFIVWYCFKYKLLNLISQVVPGSVFFPRIVHHFAIKSGRSFWMVFVLKVSGELPQTLAGLPSDALDFAVLNNRSYLTVEAVEGISTDDWDWLGWSLTSLVRICKNILWACVFFVSSFCIWIFARSLKVLLIALSLDWTI